LVAFKVHSSGMEVDGMIPRIHQQIDSQDNFMLLAPFERSFKNVIFQILTSIQLLGFLGDEILNFSIDWLEQVFFFLPT